MGCKTKINTQMVIVSKSTIETWILPHLTIGERGFETTVSFIYWAMRLDL